MIRVDSNCGLKKMKRKAIGRRVVSQNIKQLAEQIEVERVSFINEC